MQIALGNTPQKRFSIIGKRIRIAKSLSLIGTQLLVFQDGLTNPF